MSNALKYDKTLNACILVRVRRQQELLNFFQGEWVLMHNLDYKLAQSFDVGVLEEVLSVLL